MWRLPPETFDGKSLLRQVVPLLFGFGACQFMFTSDTMFAKAYFTGDEMAPYVAAGTLSRALLWLVLPLAAVMFPKIVHAAAKSEKTNLFNLVVLGTAVLAICGGLGLWLVGPMVVKIVYKTSYVAATTALLPWYAGAMVPLALANVMVNDLLARARFGVVPLWWCWRWPMASRCRDAEPFSGPAGSGAANARRIQPAAVRRLRVVRLGREGKRRWKIENSRWQ